jgi:hypothetical protein
MNFRDKIKHCIAPNKGGEAKGPNLRTKHHNLTDSRHRCRKIAAHGRTTRATSLHKHELIDPATSGMRGTMKMKKYRWGRHALPTGFAERKYLKGSNSLTINKSTMDHRNPNLG